MPSSAGHPAPVHLGAIAKSHHIPIELPQESADHSGIGVETVARSWCLTELDGLQDGISESLKMRVQRRIPRVFVNDRPEFERVGQRLASTVNVTLVAAICLPAQPDKQRCR